MSEKSETNERRTIPEMRVETRQIAANLRRLAEGEILTYEQINLMTGCDVQEEHRYMLYTARKVVEKELQCLFGVVHGVGIKRLSAADNPTEIDGARQVIRRKALRTIARARNASWAKMTESERTSLNATRTIMHFVAKSASDKAMSDITEKVPMVDGPVPFAKMIEHFAKK